MHIPTKVTPLLQEFADVFMKALAVGRWITAFKRRVALYWFDPQLGYIPNRLAYWMSPS